MVPPWVPPLPPPPPPEPEEETEEGKPDEKPESKPEGPKPAPPPKPGPIPIAPDRRFATARGAAGRFAESGRALDMKRSVGRYIGSGYGGAPTATQRFGGTIENAGALYSALSPGEGAAIDAVSRRLNRDLLVGRSATEIMDAVVEAVRPGDSTLDGEASRWAIKGSLSEVLQRFPDANLLELTDEQRLFAIERYVALDVFQRYELDIGKTIQDRAQSSATALSRLKDIKEYIRETVAAAFRKLRKTAQRLSSERVSSIVHSALFQALQTFENEGA
ncbi:MAG TPA: Qat anti-phage system associated protein QatB [Xanthobacteraceae bacterium]|nr:Qat anti-phage system associated protein QatB [Xanthobacteraceae bacterium]